MLLLDQPDVIYGVCNTKLDYFLIPISYNKYEVILLLELWGPWLVMPLFAEQEASLQLMTEHAIVGDTC